MIRNLFKRLLYSKNGIRIIWIVLVLIVLIVVSEVIIVDPIGTLLQQIGFPEDNGITATNWAQAIGVVIKRGIRMTIVLLSVFLVIKWLLKKSFNFIGLSGGRHILLQLFIGIGLGFIIQITALLLMWVFGWYRIVGLSWHFNQPSILAPALLFAFIYSAETGVIEESLFRGFFMNLITDRYNLTKAIVSSSVLFGLLHFSGTSNEFPWWMSLLSATVAGFLFAQAYLLYNSLAISKKLQLNVSTLDAAHHFFKMQPISYFRIVEFNYYIFRKDIIFESRRVFINNDHRYSFV